MTITISSERTPLPNIIAPSKKLKDVREVVPTIEIVKAKDVTKSKPLKAL